MSFLRNDWSRRRTFGRNLPYAFVLVFCWVVVQAQTAGNTPAGLAWRVQGRWQLAGNGALLRAGDTVEPESLLQPGNEAVNHSITILLADGQRVLYECFTPADCARGFRVPALTRTPEPFALEMLARIQSGLLRDGHSLFTAPGLAHPLNLPGDAVVAILDARNRVHVGGLAADLPNGRYWYDLKEIDPSTSTQFHVAFAKNAPSVTLAVPSAGLFEITIFDELNKPRIDLFLAALRGPRAQTITRSFVRARTLMKEWNNDYQGWPIDDFERAYLASVVLNVRLRQTGPGPESMRASRHGASARADDTAIPTQPAGSASARQDITAEPTYSPRPGVISGRAEVVLTCATPGATIHYTIDESEPLATSPVYHAPIIVMGTGLTIKSYATAPGKKDSAVVTGTYRVQQPEDKTP